MPPRSAEEKAERKRIFEEKKEARQLAKEQKELEKKQQEEAAKQAGGGDDDKKPAAQTKGGMEGGSLLLDLPEVALDHAMSFLPSRDLGCLMLTSKYFNRILIEARVPFVMSRLQNPHPQIGAVGFVNMCSSPEDARAIIQESYGGGNTGRILPRGKYAKTCTNEFVQYARFLDQAICGYGTQNYGGRQPTILPKFVKGRFVSASPEHSLCRVGGNGTSGAGGSGVASWGVGKRGQLGHGKRVDESKPRMMLGGIGYGIRIVQVSAGGGLVRVAHSLLLTSTGRVLSCGTGQYGALGHGYSSGKQLPDSLRPRYIEALSGIRCVQVAAGELHSAAVTVDGDMYTWGDGFCGQLGHGDKGPLATPAQVTAGGLEDECVANISCGARHTLAVTEDGEVFSWGLGHFGVLGRSFTPYDHDPDVAIMSMLADGEDLDGMAVAAGVAPAMGVVEVLAAAVAPAVPAAAPDADMDAPDDGVDFAAELIAHLDMLANIKLTDSSDQCIPVVIDSLKDIKIIGASAGHRHTLLLDEHGALYSCGAGVTGCLGHGDNQSCMVPMRIQSFDDDQTRIMTMSAGVDMSMAVTTTGEVYAWGKTDGGRLGLGYEAKRVTIPKRVQQITSDDGKPIKAVDVDCGYVHSIVVGLNGTIHMTGSVGINDQSDGETGFGSPTQVEDFNIWHRIPEPSETVKTERWKKYGTYEVKGRRKMLDDPVD